jgi:hypothetical protein
MTVRALLSLWLIAVAVIALALSAGRSPADETGGRKDSPARDKGPRLRLLIPAYFYPAGAGLKDWDRLFAATEVPLVVIVNPASGPGKEADPNYVKILDRTKKASHLTPIGYIATSYGKRPLEEVKADVDRWLRLYPGIQGIFFDEQASGDDKVDYQADLYAHVHTRKELKLVVTNPGTTCSEKYLSRPAADVACLFEGPKAFDAATFPEWAGKYGPAHVAGVSYKIGTAKSMRECLQVAVEKKVGYCYVTDAEGANPWERLPGYWDEELAAVREANQRPAKP